MKCKKFRLFKKRYLYFTNEEPVLKRKSDDTLWVASYDPDNPMKGIYKGDVYYYFRRCKIFNKGYIINRREVWEFKDHTLFEIYDNRDAI